jgi:hypothetical protein
VRDLVREDPDAVRHRQLREEFPRGRPFSDQFWHWFQSVQHMRDGEIVGNRFSDGAPQVEINRLYGSLKRARRYLELGGRS